MKTDMLLDTWSVSGNDFNEFQTIVASIDAATSIVPIETDSLMLFALTDSNTELIRLLAYNGEQALTRTMPAVSQMKVKGIMDKGVTEKFLNETIASKFLLKYGKTIYFTSSGISRDAGARAQLAGNAISIPTPERAAYFMHRYATEPCEANLVVRNNSSDGGNVYKAFAMPSSEYCHIPQSTLLEIVDYLRDELGEVDCVHWNVSHTVTQIWLEFPKKAKDIASVYKLPDEFMPGVLIETSDTCDCSLKVIATWRLRRRSYSRFNSYMREHRGKFSLTDTTKGIENNVFNVYTRLPQRLCDLLCLDVPNPADLIDIIFEKTALHTVLGKRRCKQLLPLMQEEFDPTSIYTAYDIVLRFLDLPEQFNTETALIQRDLEKYVANIPFLDFPAYIKATSPIFLIPTPAAV